MYGDELDCWKLIETIKLTGLPFEDKQFKKWFKVNQCLNNKIKVL
jgi:hypothetical protein